jgi:hypothetical protein
VDEICAPQDEDGDGDGDGDEVKGERRSQLAASLSASADYLVEFLTASRLCALVARKSLWIAQKVEEQMDCVEREDGMEWMRTKVARTTALRLSSPR